MENMAVAVMYSDASVLIFLVLRLRLFRHSPSPYLANHVVIGPLKLCFKRLMRDSSMLRLFAARLVQLDDVSLTDQSANPWIPPRITHSPERCLGPALLLVFRTFYYLRSRWRP